MTLKLTNDEIRLLYDGKIQGVTRLHKEAEGRDIIEVSNLFEVRHYGVLCIIPKNVLELMFEPNYISGNPEEVKAFKADIERRFLRGNNELVREVCYKHVLSRLYDDELENAKNGKGFWAKVIE